jgi:hypothetical protein
MLNTMKMFLIGTLWFSSLLLPIQATAETVRGVHRVLAQVAAIDIGACGNFAVMAGASATCAGTFDCDIIDARLGVSPGTSITGNFVGDIVSTADSARCANDGLAALASGIARAEEVDVNMEAEMGGLTFKPGLHKHGSGINIALANPIVYLDAEGNSDAVFIFVAGSTLVTCAHSEIVLLNNAQAANVFWVLGSALTMGNDSILQGTVLAKSAITINTNGKLCGRAIATTEVTCATACSVGFADDCPVSSPPSHDCPEDIALLTTTGVTEFPDVPIEIIEQKTSSVTIKIINPFSMSVNSIFTQYHKSPTGATECQEVSNVPPESDPTAEDDVIIYTANCLEKVPISIVDIWFSDCELDGGATVPECCHASDEDVCPKVKYSFKIMCETLCIDDDMSSARKLEDKPRKE